MSKVSKTGGKKPNSNPHGKSLWICEYCDKEFHFPSSLEIHRRVHTGQRPFPCNLCSYSATTKVHLQTHIRRHLQEKLFKCPEPLCQYSAVTTSQLKIHRVVHSQEKPFSCPHSSCSLKFGQRSGLTKHLKTHETDPNRAKPFKCELCPFKTRSRPNLDSHILHIHSSEKGFKCKEEGCGYAGKTKGNLVQHLQSHGEKRLSCPHPNCEHTTNLKHALKRHMSIHSEDKKFKCPLCEYAGRRFTALTRHMRTHTKERPFKCTVQGCSFHTKQRGNLNKHIQRLH